MLAEVDIASGALFLEADFLEVDFLSDDFDFEVAIICSFLTNSIGCIV